MKVAYHWLQKNIALALALLLLAPFARAATTPQSQTPQPNQTQNAAPAQQQQGSQPAAANSPSGSSQLPAAPQAANAPSSQQDQQQPQQPVGTAAAPYENPVGVAVSRPAGAAIAPAKQRRSHTFLIKMSLVIGAAVAVGTVVALSKASPSRPN
ncbi:MAG TPA: hypothetical protein VGT04_10720 [Acidobacteriaceae bacterium]|nr:hypothetical protein [Acidobacteriaceae bacterium]